MHEQIHELINPDDEDVIVMQRFKTVNTLGPGQNFGDLALQYHQGRGATIVCAKDTSLASLSRFDFTVIIGKEQRRKMKRIVEELKNYRIF